MAVIFIITSFIFTTHMRVKDVPADVYLRYTRISPSTNLADQGADLKSYYIFEFVAKPGFIIVSADDHVEPILAFSTESYFDPENVNSPLRK